MPEFRQYLVPWGSKVLIIRSDWDLMKWYDSHRKSTISRNIMHLSIKTVAFWSWNFDAMVFLVLESRYHRFFPLEKCIGITMSWLSCLYFSISWCFSPEYRCHGFFYLAISMLWFFGLEISIPYICLHSLVFVFTKSVMPHNWRTHVRC